MALWEILFMLVLLKIPIAYVGWVIWWAIKAEPEVGTQGGTDGVNWTPWKWRPSPGVQPLRPARGGPRRGGDRGRPGRAGRREQVGGMRA